MPDAIERARTDGRADELMQGEFLPKMIWSCVRGRVRLTAALCALLGLTLAVAGWFSTQKMYTSEGIVRIAPSRDVVLYETQFNRPQPNFEAYVKTQATRLRSGPVFDLALQDPELASLDWPAGPVGRELMSRAVGVNYPNGEVITLDATHEDPAASQAILNAVLRAYLQQQEEELERRASTIAGPLADREKQLRARRDEVSKEFEGLAAQYGGPESLSRRVDTIDEAALEAQRDQREARAESDQLDGSIAERQAATEKWRGRMLGEDGAEVGPTPEQLAVGDERLAQLLENRQTLQKQIQMELDSGLLVSHPRIIAGQGQVDLIDGLIQDRLDGLVSKWWAEYGVATDEMVARRQTLARTIKDLDDQLASLDAERGAAVSTLQRLTEVKTRLDEADKRLATVVDRREELSVEMTQPSGEQLGQAEVIQWGDLPLWAQKDSRKIRAIAGLMAGCMLGIGAVVAYGLAWRKFRYTDELMDAGVGAPLVGSLPVMAAGDLSSPHRLGMMANQLRTVLDTEASEHGAVFAVTSALPGEGKSTIAVALAASFAAAGHRTLLVDADPVGGAITHRFGIAPERAGFCEAARRVTDDPTVCPTEIEGLEVMPVGGQGSRQQPASSLGATRALVGKLRERYDRIVFDTGVLAGSAEAVLCCRSADKIISVVSRGQARAEVGTALDRLGELGLRCAGLVFNRAEPVDARRYTSVPVAPRVAVGTGKREQDSGDVASVYS
ncbi:MAG: P-loop NTPase [Phycisphaerales bacterium]